MWKLIIVVMFLGIAQASEILNLFNVANLKYARLGNLENYINNTPGLLNQKSGVNDQTLLHLALRADRFDLVQFLIDRGASLTAQDTKNLETPLHIAAGMRESTFLKALLAKAAPKDVKIKDKLGRTPLHIAVIEENIDNIELLLKKDPSLASIKDNSGKTPEDYVKEIGDSGIREDIEKLFEAAAKDIFHPSILEIIKSEDFKKYLKEDPKLVKKTNDTGETLLHIAVKANRIDLVKILLGERALVNVMDKDNNSPLHLAAKYTNPEMIKILLQAHADPNLDRGFSTPMHAAISSDNPENLQTLIDAGGSLDLKIGPGNNLLHYAVLNYKPRSVEKLLYNAPQLINETNKQGQTPLELAKNLKYTGIVQDFEKFKSHQEAMKAFEAAKIEAAKPTGKFSDLFVVDILKNITVPSFKEIVEKNKGDAIHGTDAQGNTLLHKAVLANRKDLVEILLENNVPVNAVDKIGDSPLHLAVKFSGPQMINLLLRYNADPSNISLDQLRTPLHEAIFFGQVENLKALLESPKVKLNIKIGANNNLLHYAVLHNKPEAVKILIDKAPNLINERNSNNETPLDMAKRKNETQIVDILESYQKTTMPQIPIGPVSKPTETPKPAEKIPDLFNLENWKKISDKDFENYIKADPKLVNKQGGTYYYTLLHLAIKAKRPNLVKFLIQNKANLNLQDMYGDTPIHLAAEESNPVYLEYLLEKASPEDLKILRTKNEGDLTPLGKAVIQKRLENVQLLLKKDASAASIQDNNGDNALHRAVEADTKGDLSIIKLLVTENPSLVSQKNVHDETPLELARKIIDKNVRDKIVRVLESAKPSEAAKPTEKVPDLFDVYILRAISDKDFENYVIRNPELITKQGGAFGDTLLNLAIRANRLDIVNFLIERGAQFDVQNNHGNTPLHFAAGNSQSIYLKSLLAKISPSKLQVLHIKNDRNWTPLHQAADGGNSENIKLLLEKDPSLTEVLDDLGENALHKAVRNQRISAVEFLATKDHSLISQKNSDGKTPLDLANKINNAAFRSEMVNILESNKPSGATKSTEKIPLEILLEHLQQDLSALRSAL